MEQVWLEKAVRRVVDQWGVALWHCPIYRLRWKISAEARVAAMKSRVLPTTGWGRGNPPTHSRGGGGKASIKWIGGSSRMTPIEPERKGYQGGYNIV